MAGLIEELKRRNVFKVGVAYAVLAWLIAQGAALAADTFAAPDWVMKMLVTLLVLAFPLVLFFAWAYELTPEGIKKEKDVDRSQSITHQTGRKLDFTIIAVLVLALGYFIWESRFEQALEKGSEPFSTAETSAADSDAAKRALTPFPKSIAVLPFVNMSEDANNEFFSDGISEEILNALAKVKELKVAGRTSSFAFKGHNEDLRKIGETLGVANILEGSVRKAGGKVRITAQLIQVKDGFHLWSESYDRELTDVFAIQDEIANAILKEMKATLLEGDASAIAATRTDAEAYELYLLAKQRIYERTRLALESAAELLDQAITIDPQYAPAYAQRGIAANLLSVANYGNIPHDQAMAESKLNLDKALALDENLAEAWAGLGLYYTGPPPQPYKSMPALEKALSINPNQVDASLWLSLNYQAVNRFADGKALLDDITDRDPLFRPAVANWVYTMAAMDRGSEAKVQVGEIAPFWPDDPKIEQLQGIIDLEEGNVADGLKHMNTALAKQPTDQTYRAGVNQGSYLSHQYDRVNDDGLSPYIVWALFNLGRSEEAALMAQKQAADGVVAPLFALLNASDQSELLVQYFEQHWSDFAAFQQAVPPSIWGYREMADVALAYRRAGNQARFDEAMALLDAASQQTLAQGSRSNDLQMLVAVYHAMAGENEQALKWLAQAIDGGLIVSSKISKEYPYFRELDGNAEYEAIQARMIEHLNRERAELGLDPVTT